MTDIAILCGVFMTLGLCGCSTTVMPFASPAENSWFIEHQASTGDTLPIYCMANKNGDTAKPQCFKARVYEWKDIPK